MTPGDRSFFWARTFACWNWKCALLSAAARSIVYLAALARTGWRGGLSIVLVEIAYVTLTTGLYAAMQQRALGFRFRLLGNAAIVLGVPSLAQVFDWLAHRAAGAAEAGCIPLGISIGMRGHRRHRSRLWSESSSVKPRPGSACHPR